MYTSILMTSDTSILSDMSARIDIGPTYKIHSLFWAGFCSA